MNRVIMGGIGLAVAVAILTIAIIMAMSGSPIVGSIVFVVVATVLDVVAVWWVLSGTAADSGYLKQLVNALLIGLIAGVLIYGFSMLTTTVLFPDYLDKMKTASIEMMKASGLPQEQVDARVQAVEATTPSSNAMSGFIGTLVTSVVAGAILAIFKRRK